jgi:hypothetical protein
MRVFAATTGSCTVRPSPCLCLSHPTPVRSPSPAQFDSTLTSTSDPRAYLQPTPTPASTCSSLCTYNSARPAHYTTAKPDLATMALLALLTSRCMLQPFLAPWPRSRRTRPPARTHSRSRCPHQQQLSRRDLRISVVCPLGGAHVGAVSPDELRRACCVALVPFLIRPPTLCVPSSTHRPHLRALHTTLEHSYSILQALPALVRASPSAAPDRMSRIYAVSSPRLLRRLCIRLCAARAYSRRSRYARPRDVRRPSRSHGRMETRRTRGL